MKTSTPSWLRSINIIAWDLDGTLYPPSTAMNEEIESRKIATVAKTLGVSHQQAEQRFATLYRQLGSNTKTLDTLGIDGQAFFISVWNDIPLEEFLSPNPELVQAVRAINQTRPQLILTNSNTLATARKKLNCLGFSSSDFAEIFTSVELGVNKPDAAAFEPLLTFDSDIQPAEILYCGDRPHTDLEPAAKLGMHTAWITHSESIKKLSPGVDAIFTTPLQLIKASR